ncbi:MAG: hypothetical protein AAF387_16740 [Pseudomonadota bacterium]
MNTELIGYFAAEKSGALILLGMGVGALAVSGWLWRRKSAFIAAAWPLVILGVFELIIGTAIALRTPNQVQQLQNALANKPAVAASEELVRMERVNANFRIVKLVEIVVIGFGVAAVLVFPLASTWSSVGVGCVAQGVALFVFDSFAHHRAEIYVLWLQSL